MEKKECVLTQEQSLVIRLLKRLFTLSVAVIVGFFGAYMVWVSLKPWLKGGELDVQGIFWGIFMLILVPLFFWAQKINGRRLARKQNNQ